MPYAVDTAKKSAGADLTLEGLEITSIDFPIESMARILLLALQAVYDNPEGQAAFEDRKKQQKRKGQKPKKYQKGIQKDIRKKDT